MKTIVFLTILSVLILCNTSRCFAQIKQSNEIKAGAAKVSITPDKNELPKNYLDINDSIYSRAIVVDNGISSAALITADVGMVGDPIWNNVSRRIEKELGIPIANIVLTAVHTHSVPYNLGGVKLEPEIFASVKEAKSKLQPARIGYGTGVSYYSRYIWFYIKFNGHCGFGCRSI